MLLFNSMVDGNKYLVVVSVLEGRHFPKRPGYQLVAEARFDGELLQTDAVVHVESPTFSQELAWQLQKRALQQQRMQRAAVKVQLYAVCVQSSAREPIGFVVLDLRSASNKQTSKWHHLLHSKYSQSKPEVKLGIYIDDDSQQAADSSFKAKEAPARAGKSKLTDGPDFDSKDLNPVLNDLDGFYQIGPSDSCHETFVLSVTIAFAANLPQLIPTDIPLPATGFFFYYSLLGNDVTNEVFHDLLNPTFPAERASVQLRSSVEALSQFFASQPGIQIHLCCGDQSLGNADVPLQSLLRKGSTEIFMKPVSVEGTFPLLPPNRTKEQLIGVPDDLRPLVGLAIVLRKDDQVMVDTPVKEPTPKAAEHPLSPSRPLTKPATQPPESPNCPAKSSPPQRTPTKKARGEKAMISPVRPVSPPGPHDGSYTETFESGQSEHEGKEANKVANDAAAGMNVHANDETSKPNEIKGSSQQPTNPTIPQVATHVMALAPNDVLVTTTSTGTQQSAPPPPSSETRHFSCSIDLRSVRNVSAGQSACLFVRYTYAFFGSAAPIMTQPPVDVCQGSEVKLPQSFCAFDFATSAAQLIETFRSVPLVVEVYDRDRQRSQTLQLGFARVNLSSVLAAPAVKAVHSSGKCGWRRVYSERIAFHENSESGGQQHLGDIDTVICLDDWGPISTQQIAARGDSTSQGGSVSESSQPAPNRQAPPPGLPPGPPPGPVEMRQTAEYKAALELEMWKDQQEQAFQQQLKTRELQHMKSLSDEWKTRDKERELLVKKKVAEYDGLEQKLRKTLNDLEKRDRQLAANEQEVLRLKTDLEREHERKLTEMREASHHLKDSADHQVQLEKARCAELAEQVTRLKQQVVEAERRTSELDAQFRAFRSEQGSKPEVRLQAEINMLTLEKTELERKVTATAQSKVHYKQQWGRALRELAKLRQRQQVAARTHLRQQQHELAHMRMRHLAAEQKDAIEQTEHGELEAIRGELEQLRELGSAHTNSATQPVATNNSVITESDAHVARLIEERDTLLRTGVYSAGDRIISELERQIRDAIANRTHASH